jgi:hypothetical protein
MILERLALRCLCLAAMMRLSCAQAGVWGIDPQIGVVGDYSSNAQLLDAPHTAQADAALLLNAPTTYNGNAFEFYITPSFRLSNSPGYSAVTSDYEHLNVKSELDADRDVYSASALIGRDSSLYYDYLTNGGTGVRRDTLMGDGNWDHSFTERLELDADINWTRTQYAEGAGVATLTDYKYISLSPTLAWNSSERGKLTASASVGRYDSLDGTTSSKNGNVQLGFARQLSELWSLTAAAGYSRAVNRLSGDEQVLEFTPQGPELVLVPFTAKSAQNGTVYSMNLSRKGERWSLNATASRQLTPTGFDYLATLTVYELTTTYAYTERWSFGSDTRYVRSETPQQQATPKYIGINASWRWTEHWSLTVGASYVTESYSPPHGAEVSSSELSITLARQFDHIKFQ